MSIVLDEEGLFRTQSPVVVLKGLNDVGGADAAKSAEAINAGFNLIREPFTWHAMQKAPDAAIDFRQLDAEVKRLTDAGFYVILDNHQSQWSPALFQYGYGFPRWLYPDAHPDAERGGADKAKVAFYLNQHTYGFKGKKPLWDMIQDFLVAVAQRYKTNPRVIGLDLINEPGRGGEGFPDGTHLRAFYEKMAKALQPIVPQWLMVCENGTSNNVIHGVQPFKTAAELPQVYNYVHSIHFYPIYQAGSKKSEDAQADAQWGPIEGDFRLARDNGHAWWLGEHAAWGASQDKPEFHWPSWSRLTREMSQFLADNQASWAYWAWQKGAGPTLTGANGKLIPEILDAMAPALKV